MDTITLIRKINQASEDHYHSQSFEHDLYLKKCNTALIEYLKEGLLKDSYLYTALAYEDRKRNPDVQFVNQLEKYDYFDLEIQKIFGPIIVGENGKDSLLNDIHNHKSVSITLTFLKDDVGPDLFLADKKLYRHIWSQNEELVKIHFFSLSALEYDNDFEAFFLLNEEKMKEFFKYPEFNIVNDDKKTARLLWYYKRMEIDYLMKYPEKGFFTHFLRPGIIPFEYNILFILATNRILTENELSIINLTISKIVSLMATKKEGQKNIHYLYGVGHFLKTEIAPLITLLSLKNESAVELKRQVAKALSISNTALNAAIILDLFAKTLAKRIKEPGYNFYRDDKVKRAIKLDKSSFVKYHLTNESLPILKTIKQIVDQINELDDPDRQLDIIFPTKFINISPFLTFDLSDDDIVILAPSNEIYAILFREILKNVSRSVNDACRTIHISELDGELFVSRCIENSDSNTLESLGIGFENFSKINDVLSGMKLLEIYMEVYSLGEIMHQQVRGEVFPELITKIKFNGLKIVNQNLYGNDTHSSY